MNKTKMTLEILLFIVIILVVGFLCFHQASILLSPTTPQNVNNSVCFGTNCFSVELAKTEAEREKGLMNRSQLDKNKGMLFVFDKDGMYYFWMKNTLIALDIIWLDASGKVVFIGQNVQPCRDLICTPIGPTQKSKYVLEINGGLSDDLGIKVGDKAIIIIK